MTAILGYADGTHCWIAGDSAIQNASWERMTIQERKVFRRGDLIIGVSGRWSVNQLLQTLFVPPDHAPVVLDWQYLAGDFVLAMQRLLNDHEVPMKTEASSTGIMVGYRGVIYQIDECFNVNVPMPQIRSDGSGGNTARGAFQAFLDCGLSVEPAMIKALEIASKYDLSVAPPFYVECI